MNDHIEDTMDAPKVNLDGIMAKISKLLTLAEHPNTSEVEATAFREKAETLMQQYRIEESMLIMTDPGSAVRPITRTWGVCESNSHWYQHFYSLMSYCAKHAGVRMAYKYGPDPDNDGKLSILAILVGYESDVRYAIMLHTIVRMAFSGKLEPKVDPELSDDDNVYILRNAGIERQRIAIMMGWGGDAEGGTAKVTPAYKRACRARGEDPLVVGRSVNAKTYRESFADAFVSGVYYRLQAMAATHGVEAKGELVLANRKENVDEAFYELYPDLRPKANGSVPASASRQRYRKLPERPYSALGARAGRKAADEIDMSARTARAARKLEG